MPAQGRIMATEPDMETRRTAFAIQATYSDNGGTGIKPLSNTAAVYLRYPVMVAAELTDNNGFTEKDSSGTRYLMYPQNDGWIKIAQVDLNNISSIELASIGLNTLQALHVELRGGKPDGTSLGAVDVSNLKGNINIPVQNSGSGLQDIYIVFKTPGSGNPRPLLKSIRFVQAPILVAKR
jgi:hypothetical protein